MTRTLFCCSLVWVIGASAQVTRAQVDPAQPRLVLQTAQGVSVGAIHPRGTLAVTGSGNDGSLRLWDVGSGRELASWAAHTDWISDVAFSPSGEAVASVGADGSLKMWGVQGRQLWFGHQETGEGTTVAFSPDGQYVLMGFRGGATLLDVRTGRAVRRIAAEDAIGAAYIPAAQGLESGGVLLIHGEALPVVTNAVAMARLASRMGTGVRPGVMLGYEATAASVWPLGAEGSARRVAMRGAFLGVLPPHSGGVLTYLGEEAAIAVWDVSTGGAEVVLNTVGQGGERFSATCMDVFAGDGLSFLIGTDRGFAILASDSLAVLRHEADAKGEPTIRDCMFSGDGELAITVGLGEEAIIWSTASGDLVRTLGGRVEDVIQATVAADGEHLVVSTSRATDVWSLTRGRPVYSVKPEELGWSLAPRSYFDYSPYDATPVQFERSPDGRPKLVVDGAPVGPLWDPISRRPLFGLRAVLGAPDVELSPDGRWLATVDRLTGEVCIYGTSDGRERDCFADARLGNGVSFSADGRWVALADGHNAVVVEGLSGGVPPLEISLYDLKDSLGYSFDQPEYLGTPIAAFSPGSDSLLVVDAALRAGLWSVSGRHLLRAFELGPAMTWITSLHFLGPERVLASGTGQDRAGIFELGPGGGAVFLEGHGGPVWMSMPSPDRRFVLTVGDDRVVRLWDARTGAELARIVTLGGGAWAVVSPDGRFDTNDFDGIGGLHWVMPDDPLAPLPIEAFMADYYEPRLLPRVLAGEAFPDIGSLSERNRVQPEVEITSAGVGEDGTATVTVEVAGLAREYGGDTHQSGAYDLRLFRDGQLVGWRDGEVVRGTNRETVTFRGIGVPTDTEALHFSAYAFNVDRVKSRTASAEVAVGPTPRRQKRAFVVSLGVDAFRDPTWDLSFAAADARAYTRALDSTLAGSGEYAEVVALALVSDHGGADHGTAAALRGALLRLAGDPLDAEAEAALARVPGAERLREATPDDLVLLTASTHGYAAEDGAFYLLPADVPPAGASGAITPALLEAAVSSDELSAWLRGVDAGTLAVIVDACHAAGAVEGSGFKPGPMGARGLGQLAFDKGAVVLAATQAASTALEADATGRGLLTFALLENGLLARQADGAVTEVGNGFTGARDERITLSEWLAYGVARVPSLHNEVATGAVETYGRGGVRTRSMPPDVAVSAEGQDAELQTPSLFDFRRGRRDVTVAGGAADGDG